MSFYPVQNPVYGRTNIQTVRPGQNPRIGDPSNHSSNDEVKIVVGTRLPTSPIPVVNRGQTKYTSSSRQEKREAIQKLAEIHIGSTQSLQQQAPQQQVRQAGQTDRAPLGQPQNRNNRSNPAGQRAPIGRGK